MLVMDACAAVNMINGTKSGLAIEQVYLEDGEVVAPALFVSEVANSFLKYVLHEKNDIRSATVRTQRAANLIDTFVDEGDYVPEALALASKYHHSVYDMFYLAIARHKGAILYTLDQKLQDIATKEGVSCYAFGHGCARHILHNR